MRHYLVKIFIFHTQKLKVQCPDNDIKVAQIANNNNNIDSDFHSIE